MSEVTAWLLLALALAVVLGLAGYAWTLWREVRRRQAFREEEVRRANDNCLESLDMIARAMLAEQVDLTEGSLRCKVLLEIIDPALLERSIFQPFDQVHQRTAHLHTHSARQSLTPRERLEEDRQRLEVEDDLRDSILAAADGVIDFKRRWPASLH
ncbi:Protein of unknown function [Modicisalibacter ilicicola DSM 19980]|uniref:DUF2489 domain-containing protein n=1 Tax=Modicisalibacter ilicicola DSM 19980 TaxID=1121942 RepID=A0A1M4X826_9GAMM|nr:DUF2489 domain-containing protein [Halomonas ilicicola]SHE89587.1 Protein of unknown function [Halomonas ilicicola DSM 19980]